MTDDEIKNNPYINLQTNYYSEYFENLSKFKSEKENLELDKLCWEVFSTEAGKKLIEILKEKFIMAPVPAQMSTSYPTTAVYFEGFKEAYRQLINYSCAYQNRMDWNAKQQEGKSK